ncbi:MAG: winged helix-turn-helix domain-containing protein [Acidimicrobiia bacterium]|nr:winged helix-turn-helix domain-containing protein [Acidimicrobiia bacterium]
MRATPQGLAVHETVKPVIARALQAADPITHGAHRRAAWTRLREELQHAGRPDAWRYTADMLFLIGNPVVREAFFPTRQPTHTVEPATGADADQIESIARAHETPTATAGLARWWARAPQAFRVARDAGGTVAGFSVLVERGEIDRAWLAADPIAAAWLDHLDAEPVGPDEEVLLLPRWLTRASGELPDETHAAALARRQARPYTGAAPHLAAGCTPVVVRDLRRWAPIVTPLGFRPLAGEPVLLDGEPHHPVVLDFGPGSVDGWLTDLVADELGLDPGVVLDPRDHTVRIGDHRVRLAPLEHGVLDSLVRRDGRTATRHDLLREVWGTDYDGGSNVVAAVVRTLRRKLGDDADVVETVRGTGYRYRPR